MLPGLCLDHAIIKFDYIFFTFKVHCWNIELNIEWVRTRLSCSIWRESLISPLVTSAPPLFSGQHSTPTLRDIKTYMHVVFRPNSNSPSALDVGLYKSFSCLLLCPISWLAGQLNHTSCPVLVTIYSPVCLEWECLAPENPTHINKEFPASVLPSMAQTRQMNMAKRRSCDVPVPCTMTHPLHPLTSVLTSH